MPETFTPGDLVKLKSGGPAMTVEVVGEDGLVACCWMDKTRLERRSFPAAALKLVLASSGGPFIRGACDA